MKLTRRIERDAEQDASALQKRVRISIRYGLDIIISIHVRDIKSGMKADDAPRLTIDYFSRVIRTCFAFRKERIDQNIRLKTAKMVARMATARSNASIFPFLTQINRAQPQISRRASRLTYIVGKDVPFSNILLPIP